MISFGDRQILSADFSVEEMSKIEDLAEKRKYFLLRYFVPVVYTMWQDPVIHSEGNYWATIHLISQPSNSERILFPHISLSVESGKKLALSGGDVWYDVALYNSPPYTTSVGSVEQIDYMALSKELTEAFGPCLPTFNAETPKLEQNIMVASLTRGSARESGDLTLNVLCKPKDVLPGAQSPEVLLSQGHERNSTDFLAASDRYQRVYNRFTGEWIALCEPNTGCEECDRIHNSPVKENAYANGDPE